MAAGKINLQKASGGITAITGVDGTGNTQLVLPESGTVATTAEVSSAVANSIPAGTIITVAKNTAPTGYLKANGALLSRTTYSALFAAIGTTFGAGDGSTTFALPDLRGYFPRGWDDGRGIDVVPITSWSYSGNTITINTQISHGLTVGQTVTINGLVSTTNAPNTDVVVVSIVDEDTFTFTASATPTGTTSVSNANVSRTFGSSQFDTLQGHEHQWGLNGYTPAGALGISGTGGLYTIATNKILSKANYGDVRYTNETRPKNIALLYCIKY